MSFHQVVSCVFVAAYVGACVCVCVCGSRDGSWVWWRSQPATRDPLRCVESRAGANRHPAISDARTVTSTSAASTTRLVGTVPQQEAKTARNNKNKEKKKREEKKEASFPQPTDSAVVLRSPHLHNRSLWLGPK